MGLFNNGMPIGYQQPQMFMPPQMAPQPIQSNNMMTWVQGEAGAKSYITPNNTTMPLWDSEAQTIYLKTVDASGMPSIKILDYTIREQTPTKNAIMSEPNLEYVTKKEFEDFKNEIKEGLGA